MAIFERLVRWRDIIIGPQNKIKITTETRQTVSLKHRLKKTTAQCEMCADGVFITLADACRIFSVRHEFVERLVLSGDIHALESDGSPDVVCFSSLKNELEKPWR